MKRLREQFTGVWLLSIVILSLESCDNQGVQLEKSKIQFTLSAGVTSDGKVKGIELPENTRLRIGIQSVSRTPNLSEHEVQVLKEGNSHITGPLELMPGTYEITDFMIVNDTEVLYAAPKSESQLSSLVEHSFHHTFLITENSVVNLTMQLIDARGRKPEAFGYASFKVNAVNKLSFIILKPKGGQISLRETTAELRLGKSLVKAFSVKPGMNTIAFEGDPDAVYTLSVLAGEAAKVETFNFKELKKELGAKPLKITLEPALLLSIKSEIEDGSEYYSHYLLDGTGTVNINWGDGYEESQSLPFEGSHTYAMGRYTVIVTGDIDQITNLWHFAYGDILDAITGLTNLTALKTYSPSWGAVPIKVNLSNCENLETIHIDGSIGDPVDLVADFQIPEEHFIKEFYLSINNIILNAEELEIFVDNIYDNTRRRSIYGGMFYIYAAETPSPETQQKLDILQNDYHWDVILDENIWDIEGGGSEARRTLSRTPSD